MLIDVMQNMAALAKRPEIARRVVRAVVVDMRGGKDDFDDPNSAAIGGR